MNSPSKFQLRLLGNPSVLRPDGASLTGRPVQRHRLALLSILARSPGRGVSRDKLLAYLWPERDATHARQLLNQAVHILRRALGEDALLSSGDELRLNGEVVWVDVVAFDDLLARHDHEAAIRLYGGPFLDGFFLSDAPGFEEWTQKERERLADAYAGGLEALAEGAEQRRDHGAAVAWWKTRAAHDPYDSRVAVRLMQALEASGNRAGALQHAAVHAHLLEEEFGVQPRSAVDALAERLRSLPSGAPEDLAIERKDPRGVDARIGDLSRSTAPRVLRASPWRRAALASIAILVLTGVALTTRRVRLRSAPEAAIPSIAVLPIEHLGTSPRDAELADAMTDELIARLAKNDGLRVVAKTSASVFRGRQLDVRAIADSLEVNHLLEGSLQRTANQLRVRVRLIDARDGSTSWSDTYDRELRDVFAVQEEIAQDVAREMGLRLGAAGRIHRGQTQNIAAYELYLRGTSFIALRHDSTAAEALEILRQAVALDSTYAAAYAAMARLQLRVRMSGSQEISRAEQAALAEQSAMRALALDDSLGDAHASMGLVKGYLGDVGAAERYLRRAVVLDPGVALYHEWLVRLYAFLGRPSDALAEGRRAVEIDPLSPSANAELARALLVNGRCEEALAQLDKVAAVRPPLLRAASLRAHCLIRQARPSDAVALLRTRPDVVTSITSAHLGYALARAGQRDEAIRVRAELMDRWSRGRSGATEVAVVSLGLADYDHAFDWLARGVDDYSLSPFSEFVPPLDQFQENPRYVRVLARVGAQKR